MLANIKNSLTRKVTAIVAFACSLVVLAALTGFLVLFRADVREHLFASLESDAASLLAAFHAFDSEAAFHPIQEVFAEIQANRDFERARVFDRQGRIVWSLDRAEVESDLPVPLLEIFRSGARRDADDHIGIVRRILADKACLACHAERQGVKHGDLLGGLHLELSEGILSAIQDRTMLLLVSTALVLVVLVTLVTFVSLHVYLRNPLSRLFGAISAARQGNFLHRIEVADVDEVGKLAEEFNGLLARLTEVQASQISSEFELGIAQRELALKAELEEKNRIIEHTNRSLEQRLGELKLLIDMAQVLVSTLELASLLELLHERLQDAFHFQSLVILLVEGNALEVKRVSGSEQPEWQVGAKHDPGQGLLGQMSGTGRPVHVEDCASIERRTAFEQALPDEGSCLLIPLRHAGNLLGALGFARAEQRAFAEPEIHFLTSLGQQASLAIVNANLYQEKLELAVTDELTQLANRRRMHSRLDLEWSRANRFGGPLSLLMIDIDHFKRYNDINGHLLGDQALVGVADVLRSRTRKVDTVVRFGGEEFVVILPSQGKDMALRVAQKLRTEVAETHFPRVGTQSGGGLTISIGLASKDEDAQSPSELLDRADLALYVAKRSGRNQVRAFEASMRTVEPERAQDERKRRSRKRRRPRLPAPSTRATD